MRIVTLTLLFLISFFRLFSQVSLQTGAAKVDIPLYSYEDPHNRLATGITLNYAAGNGLKVSEVVSSVGSGWALSCGGVIQRIARGEPDDQKNSDNYTYPTVTDILSLGQNGVNAFTNWGKNYYPNGYLYSKVDVSALVNNRGAYTPQLVTGSTYYKPPQFYLEDREQDLFRFSFNGRDGFFVISQKDGNVSDIRTLNDSKLKIKEIYGDLNNTQNIRTTISGFTITDEYGIKYKFFDADLDQVCDYDLLADYNNQGIFVENLLTPQIIQNEQHVRVTRGRPINAFTKNTWRLTEIENPLTGVKVSFQYENYDVDFEGEKVISRSWEQKSGPPYVKAKRSVKITIARTKSTVKRLKSIQLSTRETVVFDYSTSPRKDLSFDKSLTAINVLFDNEIKYKWKFSYNYIVKNTFKKESDVFSDEDKTWARLSLLNLKKAWASGVEEQPYSFSYYMGNEDGRNSSVPPMFSAQQDPGGYYAPSLVGFYNPQSNTYNRSNPPYEPFGGRVYPLEFCDDIVASKNYVPEYTVGYSDDISCWEARNGIIKTVRTPLGASTTYTYEPNKILAPPFGSYFGVRVKKTYVEDGVSSANSKTYEYNYLTASGNSSAWGYETILSNNSLEGESIKYASIQKCNSQYQLTIPYVTQSMAAPMVQSFVMNMAAISKAAIPARTTFNAITASLTQAFVHSLIVTLLQILLSGSDPPQFYTYTSVNSSTTPLIGSNFLPFNYARVEQVEKIGTLDNGKIIYHFTSPLTGPEFSLDVPDLQMPFSSKQRYAYWLYGSPEKTEFYSSTGKIVKSIKYTYRAVKYTVNSVKWMSQKWLPKSFIYGCDFTPGQNVTNAYDKISYEMYLPMCGRIELVGTEEKLYSTKDNSFTVSTKSFEYSPLNYMPNKVSTTNSRGEAIEAFTYYPEDYTLTGTIQSLKAANMVNVPIGTQTFITKNGSQKFLLSGEVAEYGVLPNNDMNVIKQYSFQNDLPVAQNLVSFNANQLIPNTSYYKSNTSVQYNPFGIASDFLKDGRKSGLFYNYDNKVVTGVVSNAYANEVSYTSFEDKNNGNWSYNETNVISEFSPTGRKCLSLPLNGSGAYSFGNTGYDIFASSSTGKTYKLSFWAIGGTPSIKRVFRTASDNTGITMLHSFLNNLTGWRYYEYQVQPCVGVSLNYESPGILGTPKILVDELRFYPYNAMISTTTYEPMVGKTSECDVNGRITYYQYDEFARLKTVKDENRNVIKAYEYNIKQVFTNNGRCSTFVKSCSLGATVNVDYCVLAGKHTSDISQADANQKELTDIISNGQNNANTIGQCPPVPLYPLLTYEYNYGNYDYCDIVVRFYSDPQHTNPVSVNNYTFTYIYDDPCAGMQVPTTVTTSGSQYIIATATNLYYGMWMHDPYNGDYWVDCYINYFLQ